MRPQVPYQRVSSNTSNGEWTPRKAAEKKEAERKNEKQQAYPKTLGSILVNNHGVLNQIVDFEHHGHRQTNSGDNMQSPSMTSSQEMARAQAPAESDELFPLEEPNEFFSTGSEERQPFQPTYAPSNPLSYPQNSQMRTPPEPQGPSEEEQMQRQLEVQSLQQHRMRQQSERRKLQQKIQQQHQEEEKQRMRRQEERRLEQERRRAQQQQILQEQRQLEQQRIHEEQRRLEEQHAMQEKQRQEQLLLLQEQQRQEQQRMLVQQRLSHQREHHNLMQQQQQQYQQQYQQQQQQHHHQSQVLRQQPQQHQHRMHVHQPENQFQERASAFQAVPNKSPNGLPTNSLADDALVSPQSAADNSSKPFQCHNVSSSLPSVSKSAPSSHFPPENEGQTSSFFDLFKAKAFFQNSCATLGPTDREDDGKKTPRKSIWNYLDPNDDLNDYDDGKTENSESSADYSPRRRRRRRKSRSHKSIKSESTVSSNKSEPQETNFREAYEDLMFMKPGGQQKANNGRANDEQSQHTNSTARSTPDPDGQGRGTPTLTQLREDLWGNVVATRGDGNAGEGKGEKKNPTIATKDGTPQKSRQRSKSRERPPSTGRRGFGWRRKKKDIDESDRRSKSQPRPTGRGFEDKISHTASTPRASNTDELPETGAFATQPKGNRHSTGTAVATKRETKTRPEVLDMSKKSPRGVDKDGFFFTPDFFMLEELHREITSPQDGFGTVNVDENESNGLSQLSDDSSSQGGANGKLEQKRDMIKRRSQRNVEKLRQFDMAQKTGKQVSTLHEPGSMESSTSGERALTGQSSSDASNSEMEQQRGAVQSSVRPSDFNAFSDSKHDPEGHYMYVAYSRFGEDARKVIQLCEHQTIPKPRSGELLIKVMASCVSPIDCEIRRGEWGDVRLNPYIIPGIAFVGFVHQPDSKKRASMPFSTFKPGDMVVSLVRSGSNARYMCVAKEKLVKIPQPVDPASAACLPETYLCAFQALHLAHRGSMRYRGTSLKGQSILVLGGSSGLGHALIQLALAAGADYCYALVKERQFQSISNLGGIPLTKDPQQWLTLIGRQINTIVGVKDGGLYSDAVTKEHFKALKEDGQVVFIGERGMDEPLHAPSSSPSPAKLICKSGRTPLSDRTHHYNLFDSWDQDQKLCKRDLEHLGSLLERGQLRPQILERIPLSKVAKAQSIVEAKRVSGHIVCLPWTREII